MRGLERRRSLPWVIMPLARHKPWPQGDAKCSRRAVGALADLSNTVAAMSRFEPSSTTKKIEE
jgi:hypothetical protein